MKKLTLFCCCFNVIFTHAQTLPPYFTDFENSTVGWIDSTLLPGSSFEAGYPNYGFTTGAFSGNSSFDVNLNSSYTNSAACFLQTPSFNLTQIQRINMSFYQNYNVEQSWDKTMIFYSIDSGVTWTYLNTLFNTPFKTINPYHYDLIGSISGWWGQSNCWEYTSIMIDSLSGYSNVQFRFRFTSDASVIYDGYSIDNFSISERQNIDVTLASIVNPSANSVLSAPATVLLRIANVGNDTITIIPVNYTVNGSNLNSAIWTGMLLPFQSDTLCLPSFTPPAGMFEFCAYTSLMGDLNTSNDTICCEMMALTTSQNAVEFNPLIIYPNPTNDQFYITRPHVEYHQAVILNKLGQVVDKFSLNDEKTFRSCMALNSGIYTIFLISKNERFHQRLIISK